MSSQHDLSEIIRAATRRGWHIEKAKRSGHYKCRHRDPRVPIVFLSGTPSRAGVTMSDVQLRRAEARAVDSQRARGSA